MANNPETDTLGLVETFTVPKGGLGGWLPPAVRNDIGYSLQIYTPTGQYVGEVHPAGVQQRAHENDQVLRINLGPHPLDLKGTLGTKDSFTCAYSLALVIQITIPEAFGVLYRQHADPVAQLRRGVDDRLRHWALAREHKDISSTAMGEWAKTFATLVVGNAHLGVQVIRVEQPRVEADPHFVELLKKEREEEQRQAAAANQRRIEEERRQEEARNAEARRSQEALDSQQKRAEDELNAQSGLKIDAQRSITEVMVNEYTRRMQQALRDGVPLSEVFRQDPDLAGWAAQFAPVAMPAIAQPVVEAAPNATASAASAGPQHIPTLGVTLAPTTLSDQQFFIAESERLVVDQAYVIQQIQPQGRGAQKLTVGDIIVRVEEMSLQNIETVAHIISAAGPNAPLMLYVFRGQSHFPIEV